MKKGTKIVGLILAAVLLMSASVFGTLAYLQSTTNQLQNVFTVGKVEIKLDEAKTNENGQPLDSNGGLASDRKTAVRIDGSTAQTTGNEYKLMPSKVYTKDPTVTVKKESEDCYVFIKVVNNLNYKAGSPATDKTLEAAASNNYTPIATQITTGTDAWTAYSGVDNVYYKEFTHNANATSDTEWEVFTLFKIRDDAEQQDFDDYVAYYPNASDRYITIKAAAIQTEGLTLAQAYNEIKNNL